MGDAIGVWLIITENKANLPDGNPITKRKVEITTMGSGDMDFIDQIVQQNDNNSCNSSDPEGVDDASAGEKEMGF